MATINDLLKLAEGELGYMEKSKSAWKNYGANCLYTKAQCVGQDNVQKYAYDIGHYNSVGWAPWCMSFIVWLYFKTFGKDLANKLLCGMFSSASTMDTKDAMVKAGRQVALNKAEPGDIVFRSRKGGGHVGLVVGRSASGKIITIEGNSSSTDITSWNGGAVVKHTGASWEWCCRPDWSLLGLDTKDETWSWVQADGKYYYQNSSGKNTHDWAKIKETKGNKYHWYYFNTRGAMCTGSKKIDDKWYFFWPEKDNNEGMMCVTDEKGALVVWSSDN